MCTAQEDSFHTAVTKQSFSNGSGDRVFMRKPTYRTCEWNSVERLGYFSMLLSLELHTVTQQLCTTDSWVAAAHAVCSHLSVHLWTGTVAYCTSCLITSLLWLPLLWMDTPRFLLRSSDKITYASLIKVCGKVWRHPVCIYLHWMQDMQVFMPAHQPLCMCL